jgi:hypothetical protein
MAKKRTIIIIALAVIFPIVLTVGILAIVAFALLIGPKSTEEYTCAISQLKTNEQAVEMIGEKMEEGLYVIPSININGPVRNVTFSTPISGSNGSFTLVVTSYRDVFRSDFRMGIQKDDELVEIYEGSYPCK